MRVHAPHAAAARAREHVRMLRWLFNFLPVRKNCQSAITDYFTSTTTAYFKLKLLSARY
jgi:hypothetical protein